MGKNGYGKPYLPDINTIIQAGINPKNGLPVKMGLADPSVLKQNIKRQLRIIDEQDHVNVGKWYNIPTNLTSQDLERMLYYKGQLCMFYNKEFDQFFILPFTLDNMRVGNGLDVYGRYQDIKPIAYNGGAEDDEKRVKTPMEEYLSNLSLKVVYAPILPEDLTLDDFENSAVLLYDYTPQYNAMNIIPRANIQDSILDLEAECLPLMRTNLFLNSGVTGLRVNDADQSGAVMDAAKGMERAALSGVPWIPIEADIDFQELTGNRSAQIQDYALAMQTIENYRLSNYGINSGGLFEKKAHELQSEADANGGSVGLVLQDRINIRKNFCLIANSIWMCGINYEPSETISMADTNGDGVLYDRNEGNNSGTTNQNDGGNVNETD